MVHRKLESTIIERVVELIISGEIVGYRYDEMNEELKTIDLKFQI